MLLFILQEYAEIIADAAPPAFAFILSNPRSKRCCLIILQMRPKNKYVLAKLQC
jgi:hypothetical protein